MNVILSDPKEIKNLKVFGYGLSVILVFISYKIFKTHGPTLWHGLLGASFLVLVIVTTFKLDLIKPFYKQWMRVAHVIGGVVTTLILAVLFYAMFGVVGIFFAPHAQGPAQSSAGVRRKNVLD